MAVSFIGEGNGVPGENHQHVAIHWQTLSHNVVSSTPDLSGIRTRNTQICGVKGKMKTTTQLEHF